MSLEKSLLLLFIVGVVLYFLKRRQHLGQPSVNRALGDDYREFWKVLDMSIADYKAKMLPYIINQQIVGGHYPQRILPSLEARYGKAGASPWLSLPKEWQGRSAFGIRAWMEMRNMPFDAGLPALHQLEILLEKEVDTEARVILDSASQN